MEDRTLRLYPVIKELVSDMERQKEAIASIQRNIDDIRNGMHGLKEINATLKKLVREIEDKL